MSKAVKVTISLPRELLDSAEHARQVNGETRSEFFRRAVEALLQREDEQAAITEYVAAYRRCPETVEEVGVAAGLAVDALALEPWP